MSKNTTVNIRVDSEIKEQASAILESLGLTLSQAFNLMLYQVRDVQGLPFEIIRRLPKELNDGHGSYICKYGHLHDYSKFNFDALENDTAGPFTTFEDYKAWLEADDDDV